MIDEVGIHNVISVPSIQLLTFLAKYIAQNSTHHQKLQVCIGALTIASQRNRYFHSLQ